MNLPRFRAVILFLLLFAAFPILAPAPVSAACSSSITVTSNADSGGGSLRQALADVCAGGTITFAGDYTIQLGSQLEIDKNVTVDGAGHGVTVNGWSGIRVFYVNLAQFHLLNLTVANGNVPGDKGGGIYVIGSLNALNCTFSGNMAKYGGAIYNEVETIVTNCTFSGNSAVNGDGGGINNQGLLYVTNSTFLGNTASGNGGGIYNTWFQNLTTAHSSATAPWGAAAAFTAMLAGA